MAHMAVDSVAVDARSLHTNASHEAFLPDHAACTFMVLGNGCSPERSPGAINLEVLPKYCIVSRTCLSHLGNCRQPQVVPERACRSASALWEFPG